MEESNIEGCSMKTDQCFSALLYFCCYCWLQLQVTSPSSIHLPLVFPSSKICRECTVWQSTSQLGLHWSSSSLLSLNAFVLALSCFSRRGNRGQAELAHLCAVSLQAGTESNLSLNLTLKSNQLLRAEQTAIMAFLQPLKPVIPPGESQTTHILHQTIYAICNKSMIPIFFLCKVSWIQLPRGQQWLDNWGFVAQGWELFICYNRVATIPIWPEKNGLRFTFELWNMEPSQFTWRRQLLHIVKGLPFPY